MKNILLIILSFCGHTILGYSQESAFAKEGEFQLANPSIESENVFFEKKNLIKLKLSLDNAKIHYSLDGSEPTEQSPLFTKAFSIEQSTKVKAKAFHPQYLASEITSKQFIKLENKISIKNITLNRVAHKNYLGGGPKHLIDRIKGTTNFRTLAWMGFDGGDLEAIIELDKKSSFKNVIVSLLADPGSWIFLPEKVEVLCSKNGKDFKLIGSQAIEKNTEDMAKGFYFTKVVFKKEKAKFIKVRINNIANIPDWHQGKGTPPWLFIDEIIVEP